MSRLSDLHADACRVVPFLRALKAAPEPDAAYLAERTPMVLTTSGQPCARHRAALIRAAADGDMSAAMDAMMEWTVQAVNRRPARE